MDCRCFISLYFKGTLGSMKITNPALAEVLWQLGQQYVQAYREKYTHLPLAEADEQWQSPCQVAEHDENYITWQPNKVLEALSFDNIETALELPLHEDIKTYFTTMFADAMPMKCSEGSLQLLLAWCEKDFQRLQENIIGHILMKQKLKQPLTIFIAVTDDDDHIISLNNTTGEVWVERVGREAHKKLADNLVEFLSMLSPDLAQMSS